jgi:chemotaxis protein MotB
MPEEAVRTRIIIKKKGGHGGHHGGAWKVAYADFVTAMMALFIVLWLLTQADLSLRSQIARYFRNQGVMPGGAFLSPEANEFKSRTPGVVTKDIIIIQGKGDQEKVDGESGTGTQQSEQKRLETQAHAVEQAVNAAAAENPELAALRDQVIVQVNPQGLQIQVVDKGREMLFDLSSSELKPPLVQLLKRIGTVLGELPNRVQIGGHTDSRPYPPGSTKTNWELSFERANNARRVLESNGLRSQQINRVLAYADSEPLVADNPMADENRRLSILAERQGTPPPSTPIVMPPDKAPANATPPPAPPPAH